MSTENGESLKQHLTNLHAISNETRNLLDDALRQWSEHRSLLIPIKARIEALERDLKQIEDLVDGPEKLAQIEAILVNDKENVQPYQELSKSADNLAALSACEEPKSEVFDLMGRRQEYINWLEVIFIQFLIKINSYVWSKHSR